MRHFFIRQLMCVLLAAVSTVSVFAVTDKEMEEARAITAQCYLRYANDGSGYLDEFKARSMSELQGKLKAQEKENLKAFNSVKVPSDYASWDKARLVEFWSVTFFTSHELTSKGKAAKNRVKSRIEKMEIGTPAAAKKDVAEEKTPSSETNDVDDPGASEMGKPSASQAISEQDSILAAQMEIENEQTETEPVAKKKNSNTWVYLVILGLLVIAVIVLVIFAAKTMKKNESRFESRRNDNDVVPTRQLRNDTVESEESSAMRERLANALDKKNNEISALKEELQNLESENKRISSDYERLKNDYLSVSKEIVALREQNSRLSEAVAAASAPAPVAPVVSQPESKPQPKEEILHVIYLGKVNQKGVFVRADRKVSLGNTIYRLDTDDGFVGTFRVVRNDTIDEMVMMDPVNLLEGGCTAKDLADTDGKSRIVTETPGTAIFENGCWRVLRKARIRFE